MRTFALLKTYQWYRKVNCNKISKEKNRAEIIEKFVTKRCVDCKKKKKTTKIKCNRDKM